MALLHAVTDCLGKIVALLVIQLYQDGGIFPSYLSRQGVQVPDYHMRRQTKIDELICCTITTDNLRCAI